MFSRRTQIISVCTALALAACGGDDGGGGAGTDPLPESPRPSKRSDVAGLADPISGQVVVFGGDNGPIVNQQPMPSYIGETWLLDLADGWQEITGTSPSARGRYSVAYDPAGRMLLFGGRYRAGTSGDYEVLSDLWAFDYQSRTWSQLDAGVGSPGPRYFSVAAFDSSANRLVVYGGGTNTAPLPISIANDLWTFEAGQWSMQATTGTGPSPRLWMSYTYDSMRNRLIVFGGQVGDFVTGSYNDLYSLDLDTFTWSQLDAGNGTAPSGRFSAMMTYDAGTDRYFLFGGHADLGVENDVWIFDPSGGSWSEISHGDSFTGDALGCLGNPREIPKGYMLEDLDSPERRSGGVLAVIGERLLVFGGESDCSDHLDDVWVFDANGWTELLEARTGESCDRSGNDCECLCL